LKVLADKRSQLQTSGMLQKSRPFSSESMHSNYIFGALHFKPIRIKFINSACFCSHDVGT